MNHAEIRKKAISKTLQKSKKRQEGGLAYLGKKVECLQEIIAWLDKLTCGGERLTAAFQALLPQAAGAPQPATEEQEADIPLPEDDSDSDSDSEPESDNERDNEPEPEIQIARAAQDHDRDLSNPQECLKVRCPPSCVSPLCLYVCLSVPH